MADGLFTAVVPARNAIAIHTGAIGSCGTTSVAVTFQEMATTTFGEVKQKDTVP